MKPQTSSLSKIASIVIILSLLVLASSQAVNAATGINKQINFQGKVVNTDGTNVSTASYTFLFCLYTTASPATPCTSGADNDAVWRESKSITVTDGIFRTALGDTTTLPGSVDFNTDNIYLGVNFNADGQMSPLVRFSAVPYAFNAQKVAGLTVTDTTGTFTLTAAKTLAVTNSLTFSGTDSTTITFQGTDTYVGRATTDTLTNKTVGSTGLIFSGATTDITTATDETLTLASAGTGDISLSLDNDTQAIINATLTSTSSQDLITSTITNQTSSGTQRGFVLTNADDGANAVTEAGIVIDNLETTANTITDYLLITKATTGPDTTSDAIDVSDDHLFNAINIGTNFLVASGDSINDFSGSGITVTSNALTLNLTSSGTTGSTSSNSGLEVGAGGLALLKGCSDGQLLEWTDAGGWACASDDSGAGPWTDSSTNTYLTTTTDELILGGTSPILGAKFSIDGDADQIQMLVQGNGTQNELMFLVENSAGADRFWVSNSGDSYVGGSLTVAGTAIESVVGNLDVRSQGTYVAIGGGSPTYIDGADEDLYVTDGLEVEGVTYLSDSLAVEGAISDITDATLGINDNLDVSGTLISGTANAFQVDASGNIIAVGVTLSGDLVVNGDDITSDSNLSLSAVGYVRIGDTGTPSTADSDDDLYVQGQLEVDGLLSADGDIIGNASLTVGTDLYINGSTVDFAIDTNVSMSGGVNGLSFDTTTLSIDATNDRIGIGTIAPVSKLDVTHASAPTVDMVTFTNTGQGTTTNGVDGLSIDFTSTTDGATDANAGARITITDSGDSGDTISGLQIVAGTASAGNQYGISIDNITGGSGTEYALNIGTGWDRGLSVGSASTFTAALTSEATTVIGASGNTFTFNPASGPVYAGTARPAKAIYLHPEFEGGTLTASGSATVNGSMTSDTIRDATEGWENYYEWTSTEATLQDYTIAVKVTLPADFSAWATSNAIQVDYVTEINTNTKNKFDFIVSNMTENPDKRVVSSLTNLSGTSGTWATLTVDDSVIDDNIAPDWDAAGESAVIMIKAYSLLDATNCTGGVNNGCYVRIGKIKLNYQAQF